MTGFKVAGDLFLGPQPPRVRMIHLDEPIRVHQGETYGDVSVHAALVKENAGHLPYALLIGTDAGGVGVWWDVYAMTDLPDALIAVLSDVTDGRWTK